MRVLIVHGSKLGGTQGIAEMIAERLEDAGLEVEVRPAGAVRTIDEANDAVIVGGALYTMRWHKAARRFVRRHTAALRERPVWFFSSGPLDDSAGERDIPPVRQVRKLLDRVQARGHRTFGGRLEPDAKSFPARAMAKEQAGDWRDPEAIAAWADEIANELETVPSR